MQKAGLELKCSLPNFSANALGSAPLAPAPMLEDLPPHPKLLPHIREPRKTGVAREANIPKNVQNKNTKNIQKDTTHTQDMYPNTQAST